MATAMVIEPLPCLKDNYAYLIHARDGREAFVVDPSEAVPILSAVARRGLTLRGILATHHHNDHVGGIPLICERLGAAAPFVAAHASDRGRVPRQTHFVTAPTHRFLATDITLGPVRLWAAHVPGHTRGAIAWALAGPDHVITDIFTGDTLFGAGCGRLFEGSPEEMWGSLQAITGFAPQTRLWFGHEYTAANLAFAAVTEPDNPDVPARRTALGPVTTPSTIADERATNPFVRAADAQALASRRAAKDVF